MPKRLFQPDEPRFDAAFARLLAYKTEHGTVEVPVRYVEPDGHRLGSWLECQRRAYRRGTLPLRRTVLLLDAGVIWSPRRAGLDRALTAALAGHATERQRGVIHQARRDDRLTSREVEVLTSAGFIWDKRDARWDRRAQLALAFREQMGRPPRNDEVFGGIRVGQWVEHQRYRRLGTPRRDRDETLRKVLEIAPATA